MENKNKPAYPLTDLPHSKDDKHGDYDGLTKREYFAAMAMQGLCANLNVSSDTTSEYTAQLYANYAVNIADELLKQLES